MAGCARCGYMLHVSRGVSKLGLSQRSVNGRITDWPTSILPCLSFANVNIGVLGGYTWTFFQLTMKDTVILSALT